MTVLARHTIAYAFRRRMLVAGLGTVMLFPGCASVPPTTYTVGTNDRWTGRLSLQVNDNPVRHFATSFELNGNTQQGELVLSGPFGQTLGIAQWQPGSARLQRGEDVYDYPDMDSLTLELTGAALPLPSLFDWLHGHPSETTGWQADLSQYHQGRVRAQRSQPLPAVDLRLVLQGTP